MSSFGLLLTILISIGVENVRANCDGGSCFPSTGNLLDGRGHMLHASSTCGQNGPEPFCIVSHLKDLKKCFTCDASNPTQSHPIQNVITTFQDDETWWQSEQGLENVNVQLDLEAEFQFTHTIMIFKTFRPAAMFIERSMDFGETWAVYRYFARDCEKSFPGVPTWPPQEVDQVVCDTRYSEIEPSEGGEVIFRVLEPFITIEDPYAPRIQNLLKITNLRFNFTELHTLGDDLLDSRKDIKNKYYYALKELIVRGNCFCYGHADSCSPIAGVPQPDEDISKIMVHGRCECQHNTMGLNCELCKPFFQDQPWKPAEEGKPHECKMCNCNLHSEECQFDASRYEETNGESGGVCKNCNHFTTGPNCEQCLPFYYQDPNRELSDPFICASCDCEIAGSLGGGSCDSKTDAALGLVAGQCRCKANVDGARCDRCRPGFYGLDMENPDGCTPCDCDDLGTLGGANTCDPYTGQCTCKRYTTGRRCDQCIQNTWGMSAVANGCSPCDCDIGGAYRDTCKLETGQCDCRPNIEGRRCDRVTSGFFLPGLDYYVYEAEDSDYSGSTDDAKDKRVYRPPVSWTGDGFLMVQEDNSITFYVRDLPTSMNYNLVLRYQTNMPEGWDYVEVKIDRPNSGNIPTSSPCGNTMPDDDSWTVSLPGPPATHHSLGIICLEKGYEYRVTVDFKRYQHRRPQHNDGDAIPDILVDSLVVVPDYKLLYMFTNNVEGYERAKIFVDKECQADEMELPDKVPGSECKSLLFSMTAVVHDGALDCGCDKHGSLSKICDPWNGQCQCRPNVMGRKCDTCAPGSYGFGPKGCRPCECNEEGSFNQFCNKVSGQCECHPRVTGRTCDKCLPRYFNFPQCASCNCNGHADTCDEMTGVCFNCRDNTIGDHCEMCKDGYHGNPLLGSLEKCRPCNCPDGPNGDRQFSTGCKKDDFSGRLMCFCKPGYTGAKCDECASSYWGNPEDPNGICRKCQCSGNIDENDENACDARTGVCTGCLHNTDGVHCEKCRDFYYGSADDRSCTSCSCNSDGTVDSKCVGDDCECDAVTGQCQCLDNVVGRRCDQCEPNHWNLKSKKGCESCNCNLNNSKGPTCDEITGQCQCNDGFGGRTCDDCADGFYGNPNVKCYACKCDMDGSTSEVCDSKTGQCPCKEGIGGRQCDRCQYGYFGDVPYCETCGECFDNWNGIILNLKNRANIAQKKARDIEETGITGAYDAEFTEILKMLDQVNNAYNANPEDGLKDFINTIENKLSEQENQVSSLRKQMSNIEIDDASTRSENKKLKKELKIAEDLYEVLKITKSSISKASPITAFQNIEELHKQASDAVNQATSDTLDDGSLVEQSENVRAQVEASKSDKEQELSNNLQQTKEALIEVELKVDEITLSDLNSNVCGAITEDCDATCGGAGCENCGGAAGCNGAVDFSKEALERSQKTNDVLYMKANQTSNLLKKVKDTKENAKKAREGATKLRNEAETIEKFVREKNKAIKDLIKSIRTFLKDDRASPSDIQTLIDMINDLTIPITKEGIQDLANEIDDLVEKIPSVDDVLKDTEKSLQLAENLEKDANIARNHAQRVKTNVEEVQEALKKAENASSQAEIAKMKAVEDVTKAEKVMQDVEKQTTAIDKELKEISKQLNGFDERLSAAVNKIADNKLSLNKTLKQAKKSMETAKETMKLWDSQLTLIDEGKKKSEDRKNQTDKIKALKDRTTKLVNKIKAENVESKALEKEFKDQSKKLDEKNNQLNDLIKRVDEAFERIKTKESYHQTCS